MFYYNGNANNYIQVKLFDSFKAGKRYYGEYYVNLPNTYLKGCNNIAMLFTNNPIYVDTNSTTYPAFLPANPQIIGYGNPIVTDTMGWVKVSGIFTAQGGEQYLTLGNFKLASQTQFIKIQPFPGYDGAAYYVDDVSVYALDSFNIKADAGKDTTITIGDSVFIGSYTNGLDSVKWFNGLMVIDSTRPGFWVKPLVNTCYVLTQTVNNYTSSDTVCINVQPLPVKFTMYNVRCTMCGVGVQSPSSGGARGGSVENLWQTANEINVSYYNIQRSKNGIDFVNIGNVKANNKTQNNYQFTDDKFPSLEGLGVGYYRIQSVDFDGKKQYSEVRKVELGSRNFGVVVFPNPAKDVVYITGNNIQQIVIATIEGKEILHTTKRQIDIGNLASGVYLVTIKSYNSYVTKKIVKQ